MGDSPSDDLRCDVADGIATITLNRPERKNAFTLAMIDAWAAALRDARDDPGVRVVVVTGAGDAFCSGVDLGVFGEIEDRPLARKRMLTDHIYKVVNAVRELDKPYIAAVNGVAVGAGLDMALMADLRFAASTARMAEGYITVGLVPGDGGCYFLPRLVGPSKALELLLSGEFVDAAEALRIGMVNRVFDAADLRAETARFATRLCGLAPVALAMIKRTVYQSASMSLEASLDLISSHMAIVQSTDDFGEAMSAFREKRPPGFAGR
jgi:enoyl-CoA hydratase/carnithine racemase